MLRALQHDGGGTVKYPEIGKGGDRDVFGDRSEKACGRCTCDVIVDEPLEETDC